MSRSARSGIAFLLVALVSNGLAGSSGAASSATTIDGGTASQAVASSPADEAIDHAIAYSAEHYKRLAAVVSPLQHPARAPGSTGIYVTDTGLDWRTGFFSGGLWFLSTLTGDPFVSQRAASQTATLEPQKHDQREHDVGFKIMSSFGQGYRVSGDTAYRDVILTAANSLSTLFFPSVGATRSWPPRTIGPIGNRYRPNFPVIIDNMMNLELFLAAYELGGDQRFHDMAMSHALLTARDHIREDGSTYHVVDYDVGTGLPVWKGTHQGIDHSPQSTWARGQSWCLYGFTMMYRYTDDSRMLDAARRCADFFVASLAGQPMPKWDLGVTASDPRQHVDSSAAAIAASGLLELAELAGAPGYRSAALGLIDQLVLPPYLSEGSNSQALINLAVGNMNSATPDIGSFSYADYYFLEALLRYKTPRGMQVDIRPHDEDNCVYPASDRSLPVAVFGTDDLDVTTVAPETLRLFGAGPAYGGDGSPRAVVTDVNGDGRHDLLVELDAQDMTLTEGATTGLITARGTDRSFLRGTDSLRPVGLSVGAQLRDLAASMSDLAARGRLAGHVHDSLADRLDRAVRQWELGRERHALSYLEQYVARARNQVIGDADDLRVRRRLVEAAESLAEALRRAEACEARSSSS
jgi:unsaturated chondroitin disaccharide hydrolase